MKVDKFLNRSVSDLVFFGYYRALLVHSEFSVGKGGTGLNTAKIFQLFREDFDLSFDDFTDDKGYKLIQRMTKEFMNHKKAKK